MRHPLLDDLVVHIDESLIRELTALRPAIKNVVLSEGLCHVILIQKIISSEIFSVSIAEGQTVGVLQDPDICQFFETSAHFNVFQTFQEILKFCRIGVNDLNGFLYLLDLNFGNIVWNRKFYIQVARRIMVIAVKPAVTAITIFL